MRTRIFTYAALLVLAAASIWWSQAFDWQDYLKYNPTSIVDVPRGKQSTIDGVAFSLADLVVLEGDSDEGRRYGVQAGTDVVVADLRVTPREPAEPDDIGSCEVRFRSPSPDGEREWWPASSNPTTYSDGPEVFGCSIVGGDPYVWRTFFVVPAGGATDGYVRVTVLGELPLTLHLH